MPFTRVQAEALLNQGEMALFDGSRLNSLRKLHASELGKRIERARKARDRARDLLKRQTLASRDRTGSKRGASGNANARSKRKAALLDDILKRFEGQLKPARAREARQGAMPAKPKSATTAKTSKATPTAKKAAGRTTKTAGGKPSGTAASTKAKKQPAKPVRAAAKSAPISPRRALANTRKLLKAKQTHDRQAQPWQTLDPGHAHVPQTGYQSARAAATAEELHAGEARITPIQGSISTHVRKTQAKRGSR